MKILITGASGFIGGHLVSCLLKNDSHSIYGISRSRTRADNTRYIHIPADFTDHGWINAIPGPVDIVVHLAQSRHHRDFPHGAEDVARVNIIATLQLLEWSRVNSVKRFLLASTGNVYKPSESLHNETDECKPESIYAASKLSAEIFSQQYGSFFEIVVMRLFGVYGSGQTEAIIATMIDRVRSGQEITLAGGAGLYLTPIYVSDCVRIIECLISANLPSRTEIINVAGSEVVHLGEIVRILEHLLNRKANVLETKDKPMYLLGSNRKLSQLINWGAFVDHNTGLSRTIDNNLLVEHP